MATQITATLPTLDFPQEVDYPTQEDWAAFSAAAELNFGVLGGSWSTQMQLWKTEANAMSNELNTNATIAQGLADYQGDWVSQGYTLGQTVSVSGIYYICKLTHASGQNPTDVSSLYWNLALGNWSLKVDTDISGYTAKTTPIDNDLIPLSDSASSFSLKKLSWANLKNTLFNLGIFTPNISWKNTPISISSWSYATTTITLNVASHSFIAGDYIEVSGLTATTYPSNGIHLVTSVTSTTIVFTLGATPTGTTGVSSATVRGYATVNGRVSESIGANQNYSTFTALSGVTYYNTSRKPVMKIGKVTATGAGTIFISIAVNGVVVCERNLYVSAAGYSVTAEALVPAGASYIYTISAGTFTSATQLI